MKNIYKTISNNYKEMLIVGAIVAAYVGSICYVGRSYDTNQTNANQMQTASSPLENKIKTFKKSPGPVPGDHKGARRDQVLREK